MKNENKSRPNVFMTINPIAKGMASAAEYALKADISNISRLGIGFFTEEGLSKGDNKEIEIKGISDDPVQAIKVTAEIRYCVPFSTGEVPSRRFKCGAAFLTISEQDKTLIGEFIKKHDQRKAPRLAAKI